MTHQVNHTPDKQQKVRIHLDSPKSLPFMPKKSVIPISSFKLIIPDTEFYHTALGSGLLLINTVTTFIRVVIYTHWYSKRAKTVWGKCWVKSWYLYPSTCSQSQDLCTGFSHSSGSRTLHTRRQLRFTHPTHTSHAKKAILLSTFSLT